MKSTNKGLQKFTKMETKLNEILSLEIITPSDTEHLSKVETTRLSELLTEKFRQLNGVEKDKFIQQIEQIIDPNTKNELWESNHNQITWAISTIIQEYGRMPSKKEIAFKAELSRQTVHKHLKDYSNHPLFLQQNEQFRFLTSKVLARVFYYAVNGDMAAAKLYLNVMGNLNGQFSNSTLIQTQNNYIQINGITLSQDQVKNLNPDQLTAIETILKTAIPITNDPEII